MKKILQFDMAIFVQVLAVLCIILMVVALCVAGLTRDAGPENPTFGSLDYNPAEIAGELVEKYQNYENFGVGCKLDVNWDIDGEPIFALLKEEQRALVNLPVKAVDAKNISDALMETFQSIDEALLNKDILSDACILSVVHDGDLYFFWGNKGLITYSDTQVETATPDGMTVVSGLYTSGGELYETQRFTIEKVSDHFKIVGMEVLENHWQP